MSGSDAEEDPTPWAWATLTADPDELEQMRQLTAEVKARKEQRQVNEDAQKIPCQYCGRTVMQVMKDRALKMKTGEDMGLGGFREKDGKTIFTCVDCGSERPPV